MDVIALRIEPDFFASLTSPTGLDAHFELVDNGDGCYRLVIFELDRVGLTSARARPAGTKRSATSSANGSGRQSGPVDPNDLPVIQYLKWANRCAGCGTVLPRGTRNVRWNPDVKPAAIYCNGCKPL